MPTTNEPQEQAASSQAESALRERVKELTCLYGLSLLVADDRLPLDEVLSRAAHLLPAAWLHAEAAGARITVDGRAFATEGFRESPWRQRAAIEADGVTRGEVEVSYADERPPADEGPFLREERALLDAVARKVGLLLERTRAREERERLREDLLHADRLATIGRLTAGIAHEINEPLATVLGFGQLARRADGLPESAARDLDRILAAALHAREVVRKLMLFARRTPPQVQAMNPARVVEEALAIVAARCSDAGVHLVREFAGDLPVIAADPSQIRQVVVNLVANGVQAMPDGGTLTVRTSRDGDAVVLSVEDTGVGMPPDVMARIFLPFFTTRDVGQGTGIGLSVVDGIVAAHGGTIRVSSTPGLGSRFEVRLPVAPPAGDRGPGVGP